MTRFVVDASVVIHLVSEGIEVGAATSCSRRRSSAHRSCRRSTSPSRVATSPRPPAWSSCGRPGGLPIRLLGDAVLRRRAWDLATRLGRAETYATEYLALTQLQGDAFVTLDQDLARAAAAVVTTATIEDVSHPAVD